MKDQDPLIAEAKATYLVGRKAVEQGYKFVICEGDAMNVIQSIQNSSISHQKKKRTPPSLLIGS